MYRTFGTTDEVGKAKIQDSESPTFKLNDVPQKFSNQTKYSRANLKFKLSGAV